MYYSSYISFAGYCKYCGAAGYWNDEEERLTFEEPAPGCLCYIEEDNDPTASRYYFRRKTRWT